jgi:hypothetical protein
MGFTIGVMLSDLWNNIEPISINQHNSATRIFKPIEIEGDAAAPERTKFK